MRRNVFLAAVAAFGAVPAVARATGGDDVGASPIDANVRVLLASGRFEPATPIDEWHFSWRGHLYRGIATTTRLSNGDPALLDVVPLDAYLGGVLASEMPTSWPASALEAQAIVSRTYALERLQPDKPYDIVPTEVAQRYDGLAGETVEGKAAVDGTSGMVLAYSGALARVAYSSSCGGRTAAAGDVWGTPLPYLPSTADPYCASDPAFAWNATIAMRSLSDAFGSAFSSCGSLQSVDVRVLRDGARPDQVSFVGKNARFDTTPQEFRAKLGAGLVRSTFVHTISLADGDATVAVGGTGRGHGVGLCQWGARGLALSGASAAAILAFYFPGTIVSAGASLGRPVRSVPTPAAVPGPAQAPPTPVASPNWSRIRP